MGILSPRGWSPIGEHAEQALDDAAARADYYEIACTALRELLVEKRIVTDEEIRTEIDRTRAPGIHNGAKLVARAWVDPAYRERLLADGKTAAAELGLRVGEAQLLVLANTPEVHHLVVCTLCSCYPRSILGQPPAWYVSKSYRSRAVREPRAVLAEFGLQLAPEVAIRVHDSIADLRFMVLPMRPAGTAGLLEEELAAWVTRDSLIGAGLPVAP